MATRKTEVPRSGSRNTKGTANASYLQWTYVGAGVKTRTWTVTMPTTPGIYEFRLLLGGGYTLLATSPSVTVGP